MSEINELCAGVIFKRTYPYRLMSGHQRIYGMDGIDDFWVGGCHRHDDWDEHGCQITDYHADGVGSIEFEVLAVADMPRSYQRRVIYAVTLINPDGDIKRINKAHVATERKFMKWINGEDAYHSDYRVGQ